ncbi:cyclophilin-like fold protein, partial [Streptomyces sp. WELS2]|uniref:cyclophilin-like fold protein n=1 Tax=Streptomyces sp. WELS2 TaxID=2749435 RepID=UPI00286809F9
MNDSPAARDLAGLLPLTPKLEDCHGTERIGHPPRQLIADGARYITPLLTDRAGIP